MKRLILSLVLSISALVAEPKAVIFDFGGVMTGELDSKALSTWLCKTCALSKSDFEKGRDERRASGTPDKIFWRAWAKKNHITLSGSFDQEFDEVMRKSINPSVDMYALVDTLKEKGLQVGMLSNIDERYGSLVGDLKLYTPFNPCILSYQIGIQKPDIKAYETLVKALDISREDILFVDDKKENCDAAEEAGLDAIWFISYEQFVQELNKRGIKVD